MTMAFGLTEDEVRLCAVYVAQLTKDGIGFTISRDGVGIEVELTGGF